MTTCSIGSMTSSLVHPRDVFRAAIANITAGLIFIHNHPSGDPAPSDADIQITKRLCEVGKVIGIQCLDHIVSGAFKKCVSVHAVGCQCPSPSLDLFRLVLPYIPCNGVECAL